MTVTGKKGVHVGKTLELLLEEVLTGKVQNTREALTTILYTMAE